MKHNLGLLAAWLGAGATTLGDAILKSPWLSLAGIALALTASLFTIVSRWRESREHHLRAELLSQQICDECRNGSPPAQCPYDQRPERCHLRK